MRDAKSLFILFLFCFVVSDVSATFHFSHQDSKIRVGSQAQFIVNSAITNVDGTISIVDHSADRISGSNTITFQDGILENDAVASLFSGTYNLAGNDTIILQGSPSIPNKLASDIGAVVQNIEVHGQYNAVEGRPLFTSPIVFDGDSNTTLTIGIQNKLNKNIELKSGTLILSDDLSLADDVMITGSGSINFNYKTLNFPGAESSWSESLYFDNASDLQLHAKTNLTGTWTFSGQNTLNGNGAVLEMISGGQLVVEAGSNLHITDIMIKGIGDGLGNFIFTDDASKIFFSNVTVELESTCTTNIGGIYVDGSSTILVKNYEWWFDGAGSLTVDGVTLWTDRTGSTTTSNGIGIKFGDPEGSYYSSVASGTIKMCGATQDGLAHLESLIYSNSEAIVADHDLTVANSNAIVMWSDLSVSNSYAILYLCDLICTITGQEAHLFPGQYLEFTSDQTFDGDGKNIVFAHWDQPQFRVADGVTLTLQNIELMRINENTFSMGKDSVIKIGANVLFELSENVTFGTGKFEIIGDNTVFTVRGIDNRKILTFQGNCKQRELMLDLGTGTLLLENIELRGLEFLDGFTKLRDRYFAIVGAIGLGGDAVVNIDQSTKMNFVVQGQGNVFWMRKNNLSFRGSLNYGNLRDNEVHIKFVLEGELAGAHRVNFENEFALLTANNGWARLIFDDAYVEVYNEMERSFVVSDRSYLGGYHIHILHNPIKQVSRDFTMAPGLVLTSDQPNAIEQEFIRSPFLLGRSGYEIVTALSQQVPEETRMFDFTRQWVPTTIDLEITYNAIQLSQAKNSIRVDGGTITDFGVSTDDILNLTMRNSSLLKQGSADVTVKSGDQISVQGAGNKILVSGTWTVQGDLILQEGSELTFEFDSLADNPQLSFASATGLLSIAKGAQLTFSGNGTVFFADGSTITLGGTHGGKKAQLVVRDRATLTGATNAACIIAGQGKLEVKNKGRIEVDADQQLIIGSSTSDSIEVLVDNQGEIVVDAVREQQTIATGDLTRRAKLSFQLAQYSIDVMRRGRLQIGRGGLLEINSLNLTEQQGLLTHFYFLDGGVLQVDEGGLIMLGRNKFTGELNALAEIPFIWDNFEGSLLNGGLLGSVVDTGIVGQLQNISTDQTSFLANSFVKFGLNTMSSLSVTTLFYDAAGNQKILTKNDVIVELLDGDQVTGDDATTGTVSIVNNGELFAITSQGERI